MRTTILTILQNYLGSEYNATLCGVIADKVISLVKLYCNYPSDYTETMINNDMAKYQGKIVDICLSAFNRVGVEGETSHSENGVTMSFLEEDKLYSFIVPLARCV